MVTHHRVGAHINGNHLGQREVLGSDLIAPVGEIPPGLAINPTQELMTHAAGDDVIVRHGVQRDDLTEGHGNDGLPQF